MATKSRFARNTLDAPVLVIKLQKGLADRQMLPLDHVILILEQIRQMVLDAGREIQRNSGVDSDTVEFGLELLAGKQGFLFKSGSVQAQIAITANTQTGLLAVERILETIELLGSKQYIPATEADRSIVRRLNRVAKIQQHDKTELQLAVARPGVVAPPRKAVFGEAAAATAWLIQAPVFQMEDMVLYGKLFELKDKDTDEDGDHGFWGELRRENGELWRIQFDHKDTKKAADLFRQQVSIRGTAKYYRIAAPKLIAEEIAVDKDRDYEAAFDELIGCDKAIYPGGLADALSDLRGDQ